MKPLDEAKSIFIATLPGKMNYERMFWAFYRRQGQVQDVLMNTLRKILSICKLNLIIWRKFYVIKNDQLVEELSKKTVFEKLN